MWCTGGCNQAEGSHLPMEKPWLAYCQRRLFIQRTIFWTTWSQWDNLDFALDNTTSWSFLFLKAGVGVSVLSSSQSCCRVSSYPWSRSLLRWLGKRRDGQGCCLLQAASCFIWLISLVQKSEKRPLGKPQANRQTLMGKRIKWTQKALFWLTGADRENISGRGVVGTVGEVAPGWPIPCGQQGALEVLGTWRSSLGLSSMGQPSPLGWCALEYLLGLSGAGKVQRSVESSVWIRCVSVMLNFVPSPKLKTFLWEEVNWNCWNFFSWII